MTTEPKAWYESVGTVSTRDAQTRIRRRIRERLDELGMTAEGSSGTVDADLAGNLLVNTAGDIEVQAHENTYLSAEALSYARWLAGRTHRFPDTRRAAMRCAASRNASRVGDACRQVGRHGLAHTTFGVGELVAKELLGEASQTVAVPFAFPVELASRDVQNNYNQVQAVLDEPVDRVDRLGRRQGGGDPAAEVAAGSLVALTPDPVVEARTVAAEQDPAQAARWTLGELSAKYLGGDPTKVKYIEP